MAHTKDRQYQHRAELCACGASPKMNSQRIRVAEGYRYGYRMECRKCEIYGPWSDTTELAVIGWNKKKHYGE